MARPTSSTAMAPAPSAARDAHSSMASKVPSPPRQRHHASTQQAPYVPTTQAAPSSRQQARPTTTSAQASTQASSNAHKRNDRERSAADRAKEKDDPKMIGPWRIGRTIGKGSSGRVKIAKHSITGQYAAVKIVPKHALITSRMSINEAGAKVGRRFSLSDLFTAHWHEQLSESRDDTKNNLLMHSSFPHRRIKHSSVSRERLLL
jgi:hypothetical protein